jgi:multidrug resistance efflux pump
MSDHRPLIVLRALAALLLGGCLVTVGCGRNDRVELTGNVANDVVAVQAPSVPVPSPDLGAGFGTSSTGSEAASAGSRSTTPTATGITSLGSFARVTSVKVRPGDPVSAGQLIAVLDTELLDANIRAAQAAQRVAQAKVPVVDAALDELATTRGDIASSRSTVRGTISDLRATRARLAAQLATLEATLKRVESLPGGGRPPGGVPTTMPPGGVPPGGVPPGGIPDPAKLRAGIAQLRTAIARIDAGLAQAESGLGKLATASAKLSDARTQLQHLRELAAIAASASVVGIDLARYQRSLAEVTSPVEGVVVSVVSDGDVVAPGATIAQVRRAGPSRVTAWLAPGDLPGVSVGTKASVTADWLKRPIPGVVTRIAGRADYPPTSSATKEVHLTRAVPIEITIDRGQQELPPGAPVDITIIAGTGRSRSGP